MNLTNFLEMFDDDITHFTGGYIHTLFAKQMQIRNWDTSIVDVTDPFLEHLFSFFL